MQKSVLLTVLLFGLVPLLNAEILTGSTSIDALLANPATIIVGLPLVLITYAVPLAILGDPATRYRFGLRTIFLSGLIYGIINEGVFAKTLVAPYWPGVQFENYRFLGLNILWLPNILVFHAVVSTTVTIVVVRSLWPERVSQSFLKKRHYVELAIVLAVAIVMTNAVLVPRVANSMGHFAPFEPLPYLILLLIALSSVFLMKKSLGRRTGTREAGEEVPTIVYMILGAGLFILLNVAVHLALAVAGLWLAMVVVALSGYLFYRYFMLMDLDRDLTKMKLFLVYSTFIVVLLLVGFGGRQPVSNAVAAVGVVLEVFFGWRAATIRGSSLDAQRGISAN